jgi:predicted nucleic acid-binding protein
MQALDASSVLYAWDNYPLEQFPPLWAWVAQRILTQEVAIPAVALDEVARKSPECADWLKTKLIRVLAMTQDILMDALRIKGLLGIDDDIYGDGVGENDLFIIATARALHLELITDERRQPDLPKNMRKYKIPAVCGMQGVQVQSLNFVEFIKRSKAVFA